MNEELPQGAAKALISYKQTVEWGTLGLAYAFSSFASALVLIKSYLVEGKKVSWWLVLNSALISGLLSVVVVAWMHDYDTSLSKKIAISIMCGFSGDVLLRALITKFINSIKASP
jgi:hypothetical protein